VQVRYVHPRFDSVATRIDAASQGSYHPWSHDIKKAAQREGIQDLMLWEVEALIADFEAEVRNTTSRITSGAGEYRAREPKPDVKAWQRRLRQLRAR
jgi:hypothetical protein